MSGFFTIRDDALWAKHVRDPSIRSRIIGLGAGDHLRLVVDGELIGFRKMRDGRDGRPTPGLRADGDDRSSQVAWSNLQSRRGEQVSLSLADEPKIDPYLSHLSELFWEWGTPGDAEAFDDL